jgi:DNA-binding transcriptional MerR regulator
VQLPQKIYFRIGEVARILDVAPHVIRFWETEFKSLRPQKSNTGQRVYTRRDVERLVTIRRLLKEERYTLEGARKHLREKGVEPVETSASAPAVDRSASLRGALVASRARLASALEALTPRG